MIPTLRSVCAITHQYAECRGPEFGTTSSGGVLETLHTCLRNSLCLASSGIVVFR